MFGNDDVDVKVSGIEAGSATFTVNGDTVTLQAHETKQVGQSIIHLTSVEGDRATFSIDFSDMFVDKS